MAVRENRGTTPGTVRTRNPLPAARGGRRLNRAPGRKSRPRRPPPGAGRGSGCGVRLGRTDGLVVRRAHVEAVDARTATFAARAAWCAARSRRRYAAKIEAALAAEGLGPRVAIRDRGPAPLHLAGGTTGPPASAPWPDHAERSLSRKPADARHPRPARQTVTRRRLGHGRGPFAHRAEPGRVEAFLEPVACSRSRPEWRASPCRRPSCAACWPNATTGPCGRRWRPCGPFRTGDGPGPPGAAGPPAVKPHRCSRPHDGAHRRRRRREVRCRQGRAAVASRLRRW